MQPSNKFAFDVRITFAASVVSMFIGFVITVLLGRCLGAKFRNILDGYNDLWNCNIDFRDRNFWHYDNG